MGLAAAVEAAHPDRRLLVLAQVAEELVEDPVEPALVLALADEAAQLPLEGVPVAGRPQGSDLGDTEVRDVPFGRVECEHVAVRERHGSAFLVAVMRVAR